MFAKQSGSRRFAGGRSARHPLSPRRLRCEALEERQLLSASPPLDWATYLGGTGRDIARSVAVDDGGNMLVTGYTTSADFAGATNAYHGGQDAYVAKLANDGSPIWVTYLGGSGADAAHGIAIDAAGNILVTGMSASVDFEGANNASQGSLDAFVAKVNADGSLAWATFLGGTGSDFGNGIAVDVAGNALVTGDTTSADFAGASNPYHGGSYDGFVAKVSGDGRFVWATYLGGSDSDTAKGLAVDNAGNALVTGASRSNDFAGANNANHGIYDDAFVAKVSGNGQLAWATYLGGSNIDWAEGVAVDPAGNALVTGLTYSIDFAGRNNTFRGGSYDSFVAKVTSTGSTVWATYLGGTKDENGLEIAADAAGNALVTGSTGSTDFAGANNATHGGGDAYAAKVNGNGSLAWATYLGGSSSEIGFGIALDGVGNVLVLGYTYSADFAGANNTFHGGTYDAFVAKLDLPAWAYSTYSVSPRTKISDQTTVTSQIVVSPAYPIVDVNVSVSIAHASDSDLRLTLVAPDGTQVPLVNTGSLSGANLTGTIFDDEALSPITAGTAPYTGNFRPASPLSALDLKSTKGTWKLQVTDSVKNRLTGTLNSWGLAFLYDTAPPAGAAAASGLSRARGAHAANAVDLVMYDLGNQATARKKAAGSAFGG